jgi:putative protein-disulfide isomerase
MQPIPTVYYVHDPMCSWCWGYRKTWENIRAALPNTVLVVNVVGGLAPDSDEPMPEEQQTLIASYWQQVADKTGASFNFDFWKNCQPRRSTYPACRAVLAAKKQGGEQAMIDAIQHAYYLRSLNPSDHNTLVLLATELELDADLFRADLTSEHIQCELEENLALRRSIGAHSFPSLVLMHNGSGIALTIDYNSSESTLEEIDRLLLL